MNDRGRGRGPGAFSASALVVLGCAAALAWRYRDGFAIPFLNDDYVFLDATAHRHFAHLWGFETLFFHWWRPWSREFHYWLLQHLAGPDAGVFHAANLALAAVALALFFDLAQALIGRARAAFATAGVAAMAMWSLPLLWVAGVQDLWMIVWSLAALAAWRRERPVLATIAYALALASKETAAPLPALFLAHDLLLGRRTLGATVLRVLPAAGIALAWAFAHPHLGGRVLRHVVVEAPPAGVHLSPPIALARIVLALASADAVPAPYDGWAAALLGALPAAALLAFATLAGARGATAGSPARGVAWFGALWAAAAWLPLLLPALGWHAYYGLFGALGAWLAIAALIPWNAGLAALLVAALSVLSAARDASPSLDWGDAYYPRRAGRFVTSLHAMLREAAPAFAPHTRVWFAGLPNNVGFLQGDGPALRVWYRDSTLRAGYYGAWRPAPAGAQGEDRFFKLVDGPRLIEVKEHGEDVAAARAAEPNWAEDHMALARAFVDANDFARARAQFEYVARAETALAEPAYNAAACAQMQGDTLASERWLREAVRRPVVSERLRQMARMSGLRIW